jgi:hypothetical protein
MNGERRGLGCCSARPRAEHRHERTRQTTNGFACAVWPARARPIAPDPGCAVGFAEARAGALPKAIALFRLSRALMAIVHDRAIREQASKLVEA